MDSNWGILYLSDPLDPRGESAAGRIKSAYPDAAALIFTENGRWLQSAQAAVADMRAEKKYICVAAEGGACAIALALAAQLPVERLALRNCGLFDRKRLRAASRQMREIAAFARRNLSLVISELTLADTSETEMRRLASGLSGFAEIAIWTKKGDGTGWIAAFLQP